MDNSWIYFTILTIALWGVGQIFIKKGFTRITTLWTVVISATINLIIYVPFALSQGAVFKIDSAAALLMFIITFFYILFFYAIEKGQISFSGTIYATYPVTTIILSSLFLGESISSLQTLSIVFVMTGTILLSIFAKDVKSKQKIKLIWITWAVLGAVTTGAADFLAKFVIADTSVNTYNLFYPLFYILSLAAFWMIDKKGRTLPKKIKFNDLKFTIVGITMLTCGMLSFNYALSFGKASLVAPLSSAYVAITIILAYFFLHESINRKQLIALAVIGFGIILIGL